MVYVIDINENNIPEIYSTLRRELANFDPQLLNQPAFVVITKIDTVSESDLSVLSESLPDDYIYISAVSGKGADQFRREIEKRLDNN